MDKTYNGWTNYATWRINMEMLDGMDCKEFVTEPDAEAWVVGDSIKEFCEEYIDSTTPDGLGKDYALAFMSDVNWQEIAQHFIDQYAEEQAA